MPLTAHALCLPFAGLLIFITVAVNAVWGVGSKVASFLAEVTGSEGVAGDGQSNGPAASGSGGPSTGMGMGVRAGPKAE